MNHDRVKLFTEKLDNFTISGKCGTERCCLYKMPCDFYVHVECVCLDHYGLTSPGLTCYLNSVLQVLFMTEDFRGSIKRFVKSSL